jgi:hypothetical protein
LISRQNIKSISHQWQGAVRPWIEESEESSRRRGVHTANSCTSMTKRNGARCARTSMQGGGISRRRRISSAIPRSALYWSDTLRLPLAPQRDSRYFPVGRSNQIVERAPIGRRYRHRATDPRSPSVERTQDIRTRPTQTPFRGKGQTLSAAVAPPAFPVLGNSIGIFHSYKTNASAQESSLMGSPHAPP